MDKTDAHFFLEKLEGQIINFAPGLTLSQKEQLQSLYQCVKSIRDYLKTVEIEEQDPEVKELEMNIGDLMFDAENIVDLFFAGGGGGSEDVLATELARIEEEMESLRSEIEQAIASVVVGLDEKVDLLIGELIDRSSYIYCPRRIKSIVGLPGVGKTTLARKLFENIHTICEFRIRGWTTASQKYQIRSLLTDLLSSCSSQVSAEGSDDDQLGEKLFRLLKGKRYLIVIDDIWSTEPWDQICQYFPNDNNGSAIILTSRIIRWPDSCRTFTLNPLSEEDSWKLLKATVFGNEGHSCPPELEEAGKHVAKQCAGMPISILEVGNILKKDKDKTPKRWVQISQAIVASKSTNHDTLLLSYTHLPLHLKTCFLYLGLFPEDYEIPVKQFIRLWIAEGFVITQQDDDNNNLEVTARDYLTDLINRSLVIVSRRRSDGEVKTCRIHRLLRALSFQLGMEEKFLTHGRFYIGSPTVLENSILSPSLRSFVCLTTPDKAPLLNTPVFDENNFKLLKALDFVSFRIPFPNDIGNLVLLKYLALWSEVRCLPPSVTKLFNLQTLILSTENTLTLPCDIWNMVKLRHLCNKKGSLHFDTSLVGTQTSPDQTRANILDNLQTLHPLCCCNSCTDLLVRTPNITKLGLSGNLVTESGTLVIPQNLGLLEQLEILSCINTSVYLRSSTDRTYRILKF